MEIKIAGMTLRGGERPEKSGTRILAFFDCDTPSIGMKGCALIQRDDGTWSVWPPKIEATRAEIHAMRRYMYFRGDEIGQAILVPARELYWHLGGKVGAPDADLAARPTGEAI